MKAVCLISGGIDSPVAAKIAISNGFQLFLVHYHNFPFHSLGTLEKVDAISNLIDERDSKHPISLTIITHGKGKETILNSLEGRDIRNTCLICRMQMFIKAEMYAQQIGADVIVTGEILGEQASQTLDNLPIVVSKLRVPALRPLIGYNKEEVVQLSKKWEFYDLSIQPGGCCSINPRYPETRGRLNEIEQFYDHMSDSIMVASQAELNNQKSFLLPISIKNVLESVEI